MLYTRFVAAVLALGATAGTTFAENRVINKELDLSSSTAGKKVDCGELKFQVSNQRLERIENGGDPATCRKLDVQMSSITSIAPGTLDGLFQLTELKLWGNQLPEITPAMFKDLHSLESLSLGGNRLNQIPKGAFASLKRLTFLDIFGQPITKLESDVFDGLASIRKIFAGHLQIQSLPADIFAAHKDTLTYISLGGNQLTELPPGLFDGLAQLDTLSLNKNKITRLPSGTFSGLPLKTFVIEGNPLECCDIDSDYSPIVIDMLKKRCPQKTCTAAREEL
eukprot:comp21589_c0_seq1/m.30200 comp21589_c0_seq1/g.30200  ORF comp21589_c0_seq1/g.30200 comp21589_c0_seq1/m.30200 type:complete len:280 (-) comp21589_c0_seq1:137-976(-)